MTPRRVQLSRKKGWRMPPNTVKVDRSTPWGNPFKVRPAFTKFRGKQLRLGPTAEESVEMFRNFMTQPGTTGFELAACVRRDLKGKNLACWCKPGAPCHADVLLEIANA